MKKIMSEEEAKSRAVFFIDGKRYYSQVWFVPDRRGDFMAALWRDPDGPLQMTARFRWYVDKKAHDSNDQRKIIEANIDPDYPEERAIEVVTGLCEVLVASGFGSEITKIPLRTNDLDLIMKAFQVQDFMHFKFEDLETS